MIATFIAFSPSCIDPVPVDGSGSGTVIEPLLALEREDLTGALEFRANGVTTVIYVRAGEIGYASGGAIGETLGRMLVRSGQLEEDHGVSVIHHMIDRLVDRDEVRFGEVLVELGFLTPAELEIALAKQVREKLVGCVLRGRGDWVFHPDDARLEAVGSYVVGARPMLIEAGRRLSERRVEEILSLSTPRYPEIVAPESVVAAEFELMPEEQMLLRDLDGTVSISFLRSRTDLADLLPFLAALVLGGGITLRVTPTTARRPSETRPVPPAFQTQRRAPGPAPAEGARIAHSASTIAVARNVGEHRPNRESFDAVLPDAAARGKEAQARLKVLLDAKKPKTGRRRWPDAKNDRERRLMAASAFHKGRIFLRAEEAEHALPGLHRALELRPQELEYELHVKWAQLLVNDAFKDDARRNEVEHLAMKCLRADHLCELAWSVLGHSAHHDHNDEAALRFFQRAAKLDPKLVDASRLVGLLQNRQSSEPHIRASIADATERARRGALQTPLDELVPARVVLERRSDRLIPRPPPPPRPRVPSGQLTPRGGLVVGQTFEEDPARHDAGEPPPSELPPVQTKRSLPPPPQGGTPSPPSERTLALAPTARAPLGPPPQPRTPSVPPQPVVGPSGLPPPSVPPPRMAPTSDPPEATMIMAASVPPPPQPTFHAPPPPVFAPPPSPSLEVEIAPRRSKAPVILVGLVALAAAGAGAFWFVSRPPAAIVPVATASATAPAAPSTTPAPTPAPTPSPTTPVPTETAAATAAPAEAPEPDAGSSTTGLLHAKSFGHRVYVDGRLVGESGGRDIPLPCGPHKVKVGSQGTEKAVVLPCGGRLDVD